MARGNFSLALAVRASVLLASDTLQNELGEKALTFSMNALPKANNLSTAELNSL